MIGSTLGDLEKQFTGTDSPSYRWAREIEQAQDELKALMLPASQWLPIIFAFALIIMLWSLLAALLIWVSHRVRLRFGLVKSCRSTPRRWTCCALPCANWGRGWWP